MLIIFAIGLLIMGLYITVLCLTTIGIGTVNSTK